MAVKPVYKVTLTLPPSSNHIYVRRTKTYYKNGKKCRRVMNVLTDRAQAWMEYAGDKALDAMDECGWFCLDEKAIVEMRVYWPDRRRRDAHNLTKLLCDALEGKVCEDDKWMLVRIMDFELDREHPRVEVLAYPRLSV